MTVGDDRRAPRRGGSSFGGGVMLLIGLLAGIALAGAAGIFLLGIGWASPMEAQPVLSASPTPSPSPTADDGGTGGGNVSEECVRAAEYNLVVDAAVEDLARGAEARDALILQETLNELQKAREIADGASEECLAQAGQSAPTGEPTASEPASDETSPSADPTSAESSPSPDAEPNETAEPSPSPSPTS